MNGDVCYVPRWAADSSVKEQKMDRDFELSAIVVIAVFGALTIGGLMAAAIAFNDRSSFLFALGSSTAAWACGYAMMFQRPNAFRWLLLTTVTLAVLATARLVL
jgi:hypothetical protein